MRPRVLIAIATDAIGGPGKGLLQFLRCGGADRCEPLMTSFWMGPPGRWPFGDAVHRTKVPFAVLTQRWTLDPLLIPQALRIVREHRIQILQSHGYKGHLLCLALRLCTGLPWIAFVHGWTEENRKIALYTKLEKTIVRFADRVVAVSDSIVRRLNADWIGREKIVIIHNAVDPEEHGGDGGDIRREWGVGSDPLVGVVGRLSPEKGQLYFVEALALLMERFPRLKGMLVGDGQDREQLERRVRELGLGERVLFAGHQERMAPFYRAFDLVVLPSLSEGMPNAALEAMLFARPVVATRVGGIPEVVVDGVTGTLVPERSPEALAGAVATLLGEPSRRERYGAAGRERVMAEFSPRSRVDRIVTLYEELLARRA